MRRNPSADLVADYCTCRWYRDPSLPILRTEVTRFPHAVGAAS